MPAGFPANILSATIYCQGLDVTVRGICVRQLLRRLLKRTHKQSPVVDHSAYVGFLYSIFFGRRPEKGVGSTGRCNTGVKSLRWGFECQSLTWPFVELTSYFVQINLRMHRQVGPLREVLPQQSIGVFIGTALPRTLRIAEVNVDVGR